MEHFFSLSGHQLRLATCPTGCRHRADHQNHWHEDCHCGVEYVLCHSAEEPHGLTFLAVYDNSPF